MSGAEIVEVVCLIVAFAAVCFLAEARVSFADERIQKVLAEARADAYLQRALDAEAVAKRATTPSPGFERHVDAALEVAQPTPDLKRVQ